jgi:hypothetical protein
MEDKVGAARKYELVANIVYASLFLKARVSCAYRSKYGGELTLSVGLTTEASI